MLLANRIDNRGLCRVRVRDVCTGMAQTAHHTLGRAVTGDDPAHLIASCTACNLHIGEPAGHPADCPLCAHLTTGPRVANPKPKRIRW